MERKLKDLTDSGQFFTDLTTKGLTYSEMMEDYNFTRWGARKLGNHDMIEEEEGGGKQKIFSLNTDKVNIEDFKVPIKESDEVNHEEQRRQERSTKQARTANLNTYLTELEQQVKNTETPDTEYAPARRYHGATMIIHETDSHFSAKVTNRKGETVYDTEIAEQATRNAFFWYSKVARTYCKEIDEIVLMLGGDLLEGEDIYEGQAHKVTETIEEQIETARRAYFEGIKHLKKEFDIPVKVVCVSGNHGDLGKSSGANADDIIYSMLEDMIDLSDLENIKFVRSDRSDFVTFNYCGGKHKGYLTHGENRMEHIGTSSPQSDWLAIKEDIGFDAAWRGHYHVQKQEDVNGAPVYMTNSRKPGDDYTDTIAAFGVTGNAVYFATGGEPVETVVTETEVLPE